MHEGEKEGFLTISRRDTTWVTKYGNEVNEVQKGNPVRTLSELKHVGRASALLVREKVGVEIDHTINKMKAFCKRRTEKDIATLRKDLSRIDDWLKG